MSTATNEAKRPAKINLPGMSGAKRHRANSSSESQSTDNTGAQLDNGDDILDDESEEKTAQTSKCKGATTIPIFLKSKLNPSTCGKIDKNGNAEGSVFMLAVFLVPYEHRKLSSNDFSSFWKVSHAAATL